MNRNALVSKFLDGKAEAMPRLLFCWFLSVFVRFLSHFRTL